MALITKTFEFTAGTTIVASEHNSNFDTIYNEFNGSIDNTNIKSSAAIVATKLNLTTIAQNVAFTGILDFSSATITAQTTFADLVATTADINAGTVDATIGATTPAAIIGTTIKANTTFEAASGTTIDEFSTDGTLAGDSDDVVPTEKSVKTYVDTNSGDMTLIASDSPVAATNSSSLTIAADRRYFMTFSIINLHASTAGILGIQINATGSAHDYVRTELDMNSTENEVFIGAQDQSTLQITTEIEDANGNGYCHGWCYINTNDPVTIVDATISGQATFMELNTVINKAVVFNGVFDGGAATSVRLVFSPASDMTGEIRLYELANA